MVKFEGRFKKGKFEVLSFTNQEMEEILATKPRGLVFNNCEFTQQNIEKLSECTSLINLTIESCNLTDQYLSYLSGLVRLEYLFLSDNLITGEGFLSFSGQKKLCAIWLDNNPIGDKGLRIIANLPKISTVRMAGTQITFDGLIAVADNYKLNPLFNDLTTKEMLFTEEQIEEFERVQRHLAKKKKDSDPAIAEVAEKALQSFFNAYSELESFASQQTDTFCEEVKTKYQQLMFQHCSQNNHKNQLCSVSTSGPYYTFGDHKIVDNEQKSSSKIYIYTKNREKNVYRTLLILEEGKWVVDKQQRKYNGWDKSYF